MKTARRKLQTWQLELGNDVLVGVVDIKAKDGSNFADIGNTHDAGGEHYYGY